MPTYLTDLVPDWVKRRLLGNDAPSPDAKPSPWTKATGIRAAQIGDRYAMPTLNEILGSANPLGLLASYVVGQQRPASVAAADPYGTEAFAQGKGPMPMFLGTTEDVSRAVPGIRAYHGSPHDFEQFSLSKIGTGEGAQAYGHGLYFAEDPGVAKTYRDTLSKFGYASEMPDDMATSVLLDNKVVSGRTPSNQLTPLERAALEKHYSGGQAQAIRHVEDTLQYLTPGSPAHAQELETLSALKQHDLTGRVQPFKGRMYEVSIAADPASFLDWDAPLSAHPEALQQAVADLPLENKMLASLRQQHGQSYPTGADVYHAASRAAGEHPVMGSGEAASQLLRDRGIPGIKYLDAGSRAAGTGTRNYVVFDDKLVSIAKKYMLAGLGVEEAIRRAASDLGRPAPSSPQQGPS